MALQAINWRVGSNETLESLTRGGSFSEPGIGAIKRDLFLQGRFGMFLYDPVSKQAFEYDGGPGLVQLSPSDFQAGKGPFGAGTGLSFDTVGAPLPPHPDASNQALGPNLGGEDGVLRPSDLATPAAPSGGGGLLLLAGGALLVLLLMRRR